MWAVVGSDLCSKHGGHLPRIKASAQAAIENARKRLLDQAEAALHVNVET